MNKWFSFLLMILVSSLMIGTTHAQLEQQLPTIISFTADKEKITLADAEAGTASTTLSWKILNMSDEFQIKVYAYEISTWVDLLSEDSDPLTAEGSLTITIQHPLNFNPPTYRLIVLDENLVTYSEAVLSIPYDTSGLIFEPSIAAFTVQETSIDANDLAYNDPLITVSWDITDRSPSSNLAFEQVLGDGSAVSVELSRRNLWVSSKGTGVIQPIYPNGGGVVALRLKLHDLVSGEVLDEAGQTLTITGTLSTPTPAPTAQPRPTTDPNQQQPAAPAVAAPAPVAAAGAGGGFELGGHIASFANVDVARAAGMTWVKKQIRWNRGDGTGTAASIVNSAKGSGFKILISIVGYRDQMGDFNAYTDEFAAFLGQVAALGPDAIEVWNEPNIEREWLAGTINGANYTTMLAKSFNAIKSANSGVMVISGAPAPTGFFGGGCANQGCDDNVFLRQMANAGAAQYMDCIGAHYNEGIISPDQTSGDPRGGHYTRYFTAMLNLYYNTFGGARPVCWTELGYLTPEGYTPLPGNFAWAQNTTLAQHAEWLGLAARRSRESGRVRLLIIWNVDFEIYDSDPQAGYAIRRADGSCPACGTLAAAMQ